LTRSGSQACLPDGAPEADGSGGLVWWRPGQDFVAQQLAFGLVAT